MTPEVKRVATRWAPECWAKSGGRDLTRVEVARTSKFHSFPYGEQLVSRYHHGIPGYGPFSMDPHGGKSRKIYEFLMGAEWRGLGGMPKGTTAIMACCSIAMKPSWLIMAHMDFTWPIRDIKRSFSLSRSPNGCGISIMRSPIS